MTKINVVPCEKERWVVVRGRPGYYRRFKVEHSSKGAAVQEAKRLIAITGGVYSVARITADVTVMKKERQPNG